MKYKEYYIKTVTAGNTDIDHAEDTCCTVFLNGMKAGRFIISQNELREYRSLEMAVTAYMRRDYPDNSHADKIGYRRILKARMCLQKQQSAWAVDILKRNGGRITAYPIPDKSGGIEYPVIMTLFGRCVSITDVYLNEQGRLCVDGVDESTGSVERGFQVYPTQYSEALDFLSVALGFDKCLSHSALIPRLKERFSPLLRSFRRNAHWPQFLRCRENRPNETI